MSAPTKTITKPEIHCSFCGVIVLPPAKGEPSLAIAGADVFICRNCVGLCIQIMAGDSGWREQQISTLIQMRDGEPEP